jgi:hypothetical protein
MYVDREDYEREAGDDGMSFRTVMQYGREDENVTEHERRLDFLLGGTLHPRDKDKTMTMRDAEFVEADAPDAEFSRFGTIRVVVV